MSAAAVQSATFQHRQSDELTRYKVDDPDLDTSREYAVDDEACINSVPKPPGLENFQTQVQYPRAWLGLMAVSSVVFLLLTMRYK